MKALLVRLSLFATILALILSANRPAVLARPSHASQALRSLATPPGPIPIPIFKTVLLPFIWRFSTIEAPGDGLALAAGREHTCALTAAGGVKCWGSNRSGLLGDGTLTRSHTPVDVSGLSSGVVALAARQYRTCALTDAGGVWCWGWNDDGQLGDGTSTNRWTPVEVSGLSSGVVALAAGGWHTCALMEGGGVRCWGFNGAGQLGDGTKTKHHTPVEVTGLSSEVTALVAGEEHTCALTEAGGVWCWGENGFGQLGDGTFLDRSTPIEVSGLTGGIVTLAAGYNHTCAVTAAGGVKCWGQNRYGQLGDGTTTNRYTPVDITGLSSRVLALNAGGDHTCALTDSGGVKCWGLNNYGQLGDGTLTNRHTPVDVAPLSSGVTTLDAGGAHTCALTEAGENQCWGANFYGQLGDGSITWESSPVDVVGLSSGVQILSAEGEHTCAVTGAGGAMCWGNNMFGKLGDGTGASRWSPVEVLGLSSGIVGLDAGGWHTCVLTTAGGVLCWGFNRYGQLGDGMNNDRRPVPANVAGLSSGIVALAAGGWHTCALTEAGGVKCWGSGPLGDGTDTFIQRTPVEVIGLSDEVAALAAGGQHTCALTAAGGVKCWGRNDFGQLGDGSISERHTPVDVNGLTSGVAALAAGDYHTCALTAAGGVKCWGLNQYGQLGDRTTSERYTPVDVIGLSSGVVALTVGNDHTCALTESGGVKCWGNNLPGKLGDGTTTERHTPVDVSGLTSGVRALEAGGDHTCALTAAGGLQCWGDNGSGQLGDGSVPWKSTPVDVIGFGGAP